MYHKNSQKRIYLDRAIYFVTTRTKNGFPFFGNKDMSNLLVKEILLVQKIKKFNLFGYVIIPDHIHLLIQPNSVENISRIMFSIKKHYAHEANRILGYNSKKPAPTTVSGQTFARIREYVDNRKIKGKRFYWQLSFHDHIIRDEKDLYTHIEYIRYNPVKHGLTKDGEEYPYLYINENNI